MSPRNRFLRKDAVILGLGYFHIRPLNMDLTRYTPSLFVSPQMSGDSKGFKGFEKVRELGTCPPPHQEPNTKEPVVPSNVS